MSAALVVDTVQTSMAIALFLPNLAGGGAERVVLAEARELLTRGHRVDIVLAFQGGDLIEAMPTGARLVELKADRMAGSLLPLAAYLRREKPDALHATMWPATVIAILAHRFAWSRARLMVSDQVTLSQQVTEKRQLRLLRFTTRWLYPKADVRVQCSEVAANDLAELSGVDRNAIEVITNPVEPPNLIETSDRIEALWGVPRGERVLNVGSFKLQKNHALLLRAFAKLKRPNARLMIVGQGALRPQIESLADHLGIAERILLPGFDIDPWPYFASADLFVLSSDYEGFPLVLAEAMAAGLRIVSTDCPSGPAELTDHGRYGRLVPCGDADALAAAIDAELDAMPDPERMRMRASELAGPSQIARYADLLTF